MAECPPFALVPPQTLGYPRWSSTITTTVKMKPEERYFKFVRQVALEDFGLCVAAQKNLERGVYCKGTLNPVKESGTICRTPSRIAHFSAL